jgi:hypothetical protein
MEQVERCFLCGQSDSAGNLGLWVVNSEQRTVHLGCWIATHERARGDDDTAA